MIYFLINNYYHYHDSRLHAFNLKGSDFHYLIVPYAIKCKDIKDIPVKTILYGGCDYSFLKKIFYFFKSIRKIKKNLKIVNNDTLFVYTEYDLVNKYLIRHFKKSGGKVYIIEDGGFATYIPFRIKNCEALTSYEIFKRNVYSILPNLEGLFFNKINGIVFTGLDDKNYDGIFLYRDVKITRKIPRFIVSRDVDRINIYLYKDKIIFLNEPIYDIYLSRSDYFKILDQIFNSLSKKFEIVYFKFHPRETIEIKSLIINKFKSSYGNILFLEDGDPIEKTIFNIKPAFAASFSSAALFNLADLGIEPIYIFHLFNFLYSQILYKEMYQILNEVNYNFIKNIDDIDYDYSSNLLKNKLHLNLPKISNFIN